MGREKEIRSFVNAIKVSVAGGVLSGAAVFGIVSYLFTTLAGVLSGIGIAVVIGYGLYFVASLN